MAREIFVDAGFWIALHHPPDQYHRAARNLWQTMVTQRWRTTTSNWTLYESLTYFSSSLGRPDIGVRALEFITRLSAIVRVEEAGLESRAIEIYRTHPNMRWSMVDCANFACIEQRQSEYAVSFDHNFEQAQSEFNFPLFRPAE